MMGFPMGPLRSPRSFSRSRGAEPHFCPNLRACTVALLLVAAACSDGSASSSAAVQLDPDGDGLSTELELAGWEITVDRTGNGTQNAEVERVTSDPNNPDSDGDGLSDFEECKHRTDPNSSDTDVDGLDDFAELRRWKTNPVTVDSDDDARGPSQSLAPNSRLFDRNELVVLKTSPTLADTDGDGRTDFEEADDPFFNPRVAELPKAGIVVDGDIDVRLNVEYEESIGSGTEYGTAMSRGTSNARRSGGATTHSAGGSLTVGVSATAEASLPPSASVSTTVSVEATASYDFSTEQHFETESSQEATQEASRYRTDSLERTETSSSGTISFPLRVKNTGLATFTLTNFGASVLHWTPGATPNEGSFKVMATLTAKQEEFTLSPGASTPVLEVSNTDVDAAVVKRFLARPSSLILQPSVFDLRNAEGVNFKFLTENTFRRTALVEIDFGDSVETYRVATNVNRNPDSSLAGVRMFEVMDDILGLKKNDPAAGYTVQVRTGTIGGQPVAPNVEVLTSVRGQRFEVGAVPTRPARFWAIVGNRGEHAELDRSFDDIVLHAGDEIRLIYTRDEDEDGLFEFEEEFYGTSDNDSDSDGDGLDDITEVKDGWLVGSRRVYSDPRLTDTDGDGLSDAAERDGLDPTAPGDSSDPTDPDTDGDGLADGVDSFPTIPALILHVDSSLAQSGDGTTWRKAFVSLKEALDDARARNGGTVPQERTSQIWVARGTYMTPGAPFELQNELALYGGFAGGETKLAARDADPLTNATSLSAGFAGRVVVVPSGTARSATLDGFTVQEGRDSLGAGMHCQGSPTLRNLLFFGNVAPDRVLTIHSLSWVVGTGAGMSVTQERDSDVAPVLEKCVFALNRGEQAGWGTGMFIAKEFDGDVTVTLRDCTFIANGVPGSTTGAGIMVLPLKNEAPTLNVERCLFSRNGAQAISAMTILSNPVHCNITDSEFTANSSAAVGLSPGVHTITNCRFWRNVYGAIRGDGTVTVTNCMIVGHTGAPAVFSRGIMQISNSILWGNTFVVPNPPGLPLGQQQLQWTTPSMQAFHCCIEGLATIPLPGTGNFDADPLFTQLAGPDLRLRTGSPCVDTGLNFVDTNLGVAGRQPLPELDLDGLPRIVDGDGRGGATVDVGAYERQGQ